MQRDLNFLERWGDNKWGMRFNVAKCNITRVSWTSFTVTYSLTGEPLQKGAETKYLGCTFSDNLDDLGRG